MNLFTPLVTASLLLPFSNTEFTVTCIGDGKTTNEALTEWKIIHALNKIP